MPAVLTGLFDYAENIEIWQFLNSGSPAANAWFAMGGTFTTFKLIFGALAFSWWTWPSFFG